MKKFSYPFIWSHLKPFRWAFAGISVLLFLEMFFIVVVPLPLKFILNHLVQGKADTIQKVTISGWSFGTHTGGQALLVLSVLGLAIGALLTIAMWVEAIWTGRISFQVNEDIRRDLFSRIFTRKQAYLDSKKKVDLLGRISGDVSNLENLLITGLATITRDAPMILILLAMMFLVNVKLSIMFSVCLPIFYFQGHYFTKKMRAAFKILRRRTVTFEEESYEAMSSMAIVKSLRGEEKLQEKLFARNTELNYLSRDSLDASMGLEYSMEFTQHFVRVSFLFVGCWALFRQEAGLGDIFQLIAYMTTISKHISSVNKFLSKYPKCQASMDRLEELNTELNLYPEVSGPIPLSAEMARSAGQAVSFQNVSVSYDNERSILSSYSFELPKNQLIAVVGPSGVGKTTFSRLLNRLLDPVSGHLEIAGVDLRQYDVKSLRSVVRTISQETFLISGTVRENLMLAVNKPTSDETIMNALAMVNGDGFVRNLALGLDTVIGEGGLQLSGGEAQRVHLARAFLEQESEILLLDEPTTGLDTLSAQKVIESIVELSRHKTLVLWVTHRMQEVHHADQVLFFRRQGNPIFADHDELFRAHAAYRELMSDTQSATQNGPLKLLPGDDARLRAEESALV